MLTPGDGCCEMVEVRTNLGCCAMYGEEVDAGLGAGVIGGLGLCSVLTVVNDGLHAGVWGEGAARDI
jgi:tetrahydrodipicolinate N-succinyltransferase